MWLNMGMEITQDRISKISTEVTLGITKGRMTWAQFDALAADLVAQRLVAEFGADFTVTLPCATRRYINGRQA